MPGSGRVGLQRFPWAKPKGPRRAPFSHWSSRATRASRLRDARGVEGPAFLICHPERVPAFVLSCHPERRGHPLQRMTEDSRACPERSRGGPAVCRESRGTCFLPVQEKADSSRQNRALVMTILGRQAATRAPRARKRMAPVSAAGEGGIRREPRRDGTILCRRLKPARN
jgi:hypothetical protein